MAGSTVHVRADRAAIRDALARIPEEMRGSGQASQAMLLRCGMVLLGRIKRAFVVKARGGTDEAGDRWAPLSPKTIAYGRRGRTKAERGRASRPSQALTAGQQHRWWTYYRQGLAIFKGNKGAAARRAWAILRRDGGVATLLEKYGGRQVEILRDTGLLLNSLSPGSNSAEQVLRTGRGEVVVGTNRKGAKFHHEGTRRMPKRRLWPPPSSWPANWWKDITSEVRAGLAEIAAQLIRDSQ